MAGLLHQMPDRSADRDPDAIAFKFLNQRLTYGELVEKSDHLAVVLREHGVKNGDRVGLYLNKSLETAISLYAVMKAGAAYVPLDPSAPAQRTRKVMASCEMAAFITHAPKAPDAREVLEQYDEDSLACVVGMPSFSQSKLSFLDWDVLGAGLKPSSVQCSERDLAYIIFTSGSTGEPKGIMHSHSSGLAYARAAATLYDVQPSDRLSNHSPLHFDMSTFDYFCGPFSGARTVIISEAHAVMPASLSKLIEDDGVTHWYSVPFALIQLLQHGALDQRDLSTLRWVMYGGELFPVKHLAALMDIIPGAQFSNVYGPAEVNQCTYHHVKKHDLEGGKSPPIGPVWNQAEELIINEGDEIVSSGQIGELVIHSDTMMQGYWNNEPLNAKAFYQHLSDDGAIKQFYRTGDLVVDEGRGILRFLGRKDRQVKIRGFRVELDEIEAALIAHEAVDEAAVVLLKPADEEVVIMAAATLTKIASPGVRDSILNSAATRLARYAVPSHLEIVEVFPRTTSSKIDRKALADVLMSSREKKETIHA